MRRRAEKVKVQEKFMLELFLKRLPTSIQTILVAVSNLTLDKAAKISDRILEVTPIPMEIYAVNKKNTRSFEHKLLREIEKLNSRIEKFDIVLPFVEVAINKDREIVVKINTYPEKNVSPCKFQGNGNGEK
ncbi:uncharacterized protein TNCT_402781 [Trichonephila clavata]|uniref:Uncharacterized protein n=1 Tax=Trichonephila clavata TaxID=2740835 RepID=A0A8X6FGM0_TRICU|nr:uncharacterized protein TNCT_402781 [Trichonephila clavata]